MWLLSHPKFLSMATSVPLSREQVWWFALVEKFNGKPLLKGRVLVRVIGADKRKNELGECVARSGEINYLVRGRLAAVATRQRAERTEAAKAFGADRCIASPFAMIRDDSGSYVTLAVCACPAHRELCPGAALESGRRSLRGRPRTDGRGSLEIVNSTTRSTTASIGRPAHPAVPETRGLSWCSS